MSVTGTKQTQAAVTPETHCKGNATAHGNAREQVTPKGKNRTGTLMQVDKDLQGKPLIVIKWNPDFNYEVGKNNNGFKLPEYNYVV